MEPVTKTRVFSALTTVFTILLAFLIGAQAIVNNNRTNINKYLGTVDSMLVSDDSMNFQSTMHYYKYHHLYRNDQYGNMHNYTCMNNFQLDGKMGPKTETAIYGFQQPEHLANPPVSIDGICGPITKAALYDFYLWTVNNGYYVGANIKNNY